MQTLLIAVGVGVAFIIAYHTYGRWLGSRIFELSAGRRCPSERLRDDRDYVPTAKSVVFGHHFTSIAATGPIVGPAIAVMWGWLPALLWVLVGSIFIGAMHDFGALVVSLRNNGQTVGDIAGRVLNRRVRILFLCVLFLALTIIIAIFGLVIASVFRQYPATIFPVMVQIPIALVIGLWLHRKGVSLVLPSIIALGLMYLSVVFGDWGPLHAINQWFASWPIMVWTGVLLIYCYIASVLPVWVLLQPRDYINALQLITALGLVVIGLIVAGLIGGASPVEGAGRQPLDITAAPMIQWNPAGAPIIFPFLFITIACGAISGFHCLVSSGTSSKQLKSESDAKFVGYGSMLTEGFLATIVILACTAGLGLGAQATLTQFHPPSGPQYRDGVSYGLSIGTDAGGQGLQRMAPEGAPLPFEFFSAGADSLASSAPGTTKQVQGAVVGSTAYSLRYLSWNSANSLGAKVGAFVDGSANFLKSMGIPTGVALALMGVFVASFAATTLDSATRLQRYVVQELAAACLPQRKANTCHQCGYDLRHNVSGTCPECGTEIDRNAHNTTPAARGLALNPFAWFTNKHAATLFAVIVAGCIAALPMPGAELSWATAGTGGMILWPMFGATNQLMGGLALLVIAFWLWRRNKPIWFIILPLIFMLVVPAWAMIWQIFIANPGDAPGWIFSDNPRWVLIGIALATVALEVWMIVEALLLFPKIRGVLEEQLPGADPEQGQTQPAYATAEAH